MAIKRNSSITTIVFNSGNFPFYKAATSWSAIAYRIGGSFIDETYWGVCPKSNVRIVDAKTGEWIDIDSAGPYVDWMDNRMGIDPDDGPVYTRIDDFWDAEDEEDVKNRYEAMMKMKDGLPRIDLNY